ncbi:hypothetical protein BKA70DRAFT_1234195 [Coprinopsis sp. MPI-PUGE-AT-0042]|nr:hypothetical protein BKA70DRAFT_1234195 [Coprinopsis sp. MPI-PUGE-AT-0042]
MYCQSKHGSRFSSVPVQGRLIPSLGRAMLNLARSRSVLKKEQEARPIDSTAEPTFMDNKAWDANARNDHLLCNPKLPEGCSHCCVKTPTIRCDICNPEEFSKYTVLLVKPSKGLSKSSIKSLKMDATSLKLKKALRWFIKASAKQAFKPRVLRQWGTKVFMTDETMC